MMSLTSDSPPIQPDPLNVTEYDGSEPLSLVLDDYGSLVIYIPSCGLPPNILEDLLNSLTRSEQETSPPPPEDSSMESGRRQWLACMPDRPLGWEGPRRWRKATWSLKGDAQLKPIFRVREAVEQTAAELKETVRITEQYNCALVNRYRDGMASIPWHSDEEKWYYYKEGMIDMVIASVSLGHERWFELRSMPKKFPSVAQRRRVRIRLKHGSLLLMAGATQKFWEHAVPREPECAGPRYNITFRRVKTVWEDPELKNAPTK